MSGRRTDSVRQATAFIRFIEWNIRHGDTFSPHEQGVGVMVPYIQGFSHPDDDPHLSGDDLAQKVLRYIRYVALVDTSELSVFALDRMVVLTGHVSCEAERGCIEDAAASVIGVHLVENRVEVRVKPN